MKQSSPSISGKTRLYGLFADPVDHLQTPAVFNELLDRRGVDGVFMPIHVAGGNLVAAMSGLRHFQNCRGPGEVESPV